MRSGDDGHDFGSAGSHLAGNRIRHVENDHDPSAVINDLFPYLSNPSRLDVIMTGQATYCREIKAIRDLSADVCAALSEMADEATVIGLAENPEATIPTFSLIRLLERFPRSESLSQAIEARSELDFSVWQALVTGRIETVLSRCTHTLTDDDIERGEADVLGQALSPALPFFCLHLLMMKKVTVTLLVRVIISGQLHVFCEMFSQIVGYSSELVEHLIHPFRRDEFLELADSAGLGSEQTRLIMTALDVVSIRDGSDARTASGPDLDCVTRLHRIVAFSKLRADPELHRFLSRLRLEAETGEPFPVRVGRDREPVAGANGSSDAIGRFAA